MPYRITALPNGRCKIAGHHAFYGGNPDETYEFMLYVWLIEGGPGPVLVEAGLGDVEEMNRGAAGVLRSPIVQSASERTEWILATQGVAPKDVEYIFITHLHFDHVDQLELYPNARIVVSKKGLDAATANPNWEGSWAPYKTLRGLTQDWKDRVIAVDNVEVLPGIRVQWTGGHSPCSQIVVARTSQGEAVFTGDTIPLFANYERGVPIGIYSDIDECYRAIDTVRTIGGIVLPSHEPAVLERYPGGIIE